jgi:hypothetical protein
LTFVSIVVSTISVVEHFAAMRSPVSVFVADGNLL